MQMLCARLETIVMKSTFQDEVSGMEVRGLGVPSAAGRAQPELAFYFL